MNLLFGPPYNRDDCDRMMSLFFSKEGKHIVSGGTTATIVSKYLRKPIKTSFDYPDENIPPISQIEGVDLVTEGVITMNKVIDKAAEANRISMEHVEARRTQADAFKERLEAVRTGNWKASRTKLKKRGK